MDCILVYIGQFSYHEGSKGWPLDGYSPCKFDIQGQLSLAVTCLLSEDMAEEKIGLLLV